MPLPFYISFAALWILVILHSLLLLGVVRLVHRLESSASYGDQPQAGQELPFFSARDITGKSIRSADLVGRLRALLFVSPNCHSCAVTLDELAALRDKVRGDLIVICQGEHDDCADLAARYGLDVPVVADREGDITRLFPLAGVPTAVLINEKGRIHSYGEPKRGEELAAMLAQAADSESAGVSGNGYRELADSESTGIRA